jgi:3-hydroxybutyryl-CoA dehydrogenase
MVNSLGNAIAESESLDAGQRRLERIALMLRTDEGVPLSFLDPAAIARLQDLGLAETRGENLALTLAGSALVVEAATENVDIKLKLFAQLDEVCAPETILASNTSSIAIGRIAAATKRPDKVIGMHFMNPVPVMKLVEIIRGYKTSDATAAAVVAMSTELGKIPVECNDFPGFVANRILMPMINEAIETLQTGVGSVEAIDSIMKLGMAHPMGPLQLADFIGLDVCLSILRVLHEGLGQPKYAPNALLVAMVTAGDLGVKSGRGFYDYANGTKDAPVAPNFK